MKPSLPHRSGDQKPGDQKSRDHKRSMAFAMYWAARRNDVLLNAYLKYCMIDPIDLGGIPECLRFHPCLHHPSKQYSPAMLAPFSDVSGKFMAVQRIWMQPDGFGRADFTPDSMMLGAVAGGAIWLWPPTPHLIVTASVEDGLRVRRRHRTCGVWAVGSPANLVPLILPDMVSELTLHIPLKNSRLIDTITQSWRAQKPDLKISLIDTVEVDTVEVENIDDRADGSPRSSIQSEGA